MNAMHLTPFSCAAYAVAWIIYLGYLAQILLRMKKVAGEHNELDRVSARNAKSTASLTH